MIGVPGNEELPFGLLVGGGWLVRPPSVFVGELVEPVGRLSSSPVRIAPSAAAAATPPRIGRILLRKPPPSEARATSGASWSCTLPRPLSEMKNGPIGGAPLRGM